MMQGPTAPAWMDLYWLPLGAGGHFVRVNGKIYERLVALRHHRQPCDLYHSALQLHLGGTTYAIEMGPVWNVDAPIGESFAMDPWAHTGWASSGRFSTRSVAGQADTFLTSRKLSTVQTG